LGEDGKQIRDESNPNGDNPYGELPFATLRMRHTENFWGEGETVLARIEENISVLLVQLMDILIMQSHGQPVFTNAKIDGAIRTGPKNPILLQPYLPDSQAKFEFASPQGRAGELQASIDWIISRAMTMYGLSQTQEKDQVASGYAKMIDNWDTIEIRQEDIKILKEFENELYHKTRIVAAYEGLGELPERDKFSIEFGDYGFPEDPKVEMEVKEMKLKYGLWLPIDDLMAEDKTLNEEEATKKLRERLAIRNEIKDEFGLFDKPKEEDLQTMLKDGNEEEMMEKEGMMK
jgi:hypothetical protein